jgi:hypothetical protein
MSQNNPEPKNSSLGKDVIQLILLLIGLAVIIAVVSTIM